MRILLIVLTASLLAYAAGCSGTSPKTSIMSQGEKLYRGNCASCHRLLAPAEHDGPTWKTYIEKYGKRLSSNEKGLVYNYLTTASLQNN